MANTYTINVKGTDNIEYKIQDLKNLILIDKDSKENHSDLDYFIRSGIAKKNNKQVGFKTITSENEDLFVIDGATNTVYKVGEYLKFEDCDIAYDNNDPNSGGVVITFREEDETTTE